MAFPRKINAPVAPPPLRAPGVPPDANVILAYNRTQPGFRPENEVNDLVQQYRQIAALGKGFANKAKPPTA